MLVFISHSRVNSSTAMKLGTELTNRGFDTWLDLRDLEPGADWNDAVSTAIQKAAAFVFLIGPPGPEDRWQRFEWQQVVDNEYYLDPAKPLIPVLIGNPDLPGFLKARRTLSLGEDQTLLGQAADSIVSILNDPAMSIDEAKLELGRRAKRQALNSLREYSTALAEDEVKQRSIKAVE
jgi:hypothetical protein